MGGDSGLGQGVGVWEGFRSAGSGRRSPQLAPRGWRHVPRLLGGGVARWLCALPPPAGAAPAVPIGHGSWPVGTAVTALGAGRGQCTEPPWLPGSRGTCCCFRGAMRNQVGSLPAHTDWTFNSPVGGADWIHHSPFLTRLSVENWTPGNPTMCARYESWNTICEKDTVNYTCTTYFSLNKHREIMKNCWHILATYVCS